MASRIKTCLAILLTGLSFLSSSLHAATRTVCSSGCDDTTIANAISNAVDGDTIQLKANETETTSLTIATSKALTFISDSTVRTITNGGSNPTIIINTSQTKSVTFKNLIVSNVNDKSTFNLAFASNVAVTISNCTVKTSLILTNDNEGAFAVQSAPAAGSSLNINNTEVFGLGNTSNGGEGYTDKSVTMIANFLNINNCIFQIGRAHV